MATNDTPTYNGTYCCVVGCHKDTADDKGKVSFFTFPTRNEEKRQLWIKAVNHSNWEPKKWTKICSLLKITLLEDGVELSHSGFCSSTRPRRGGNKFHRAEWGIEHDRGGNNKYRVARSMDRSPVALMMLRNVIRSMSSCAEFNKIGATSESTGHDGVVLNKESLDDGCAGPTSHSKATWSPR